MRRRLLIAATAAAMVLAVAGPARAEDATPADPPPDVGSTAPESPTADPTPGPEPTPPSEPTPEPTLESPPQVTPKASKLPLRTGAIGWRVADVQERLEWLGYEIYPGNLERERMGVSTTNAVRTFQVKFGLRPTGVVGPGTWAKLKDVAGKVGWLPRACRGERALCIDKTQRLVRLVEDGEVITALDARFGFPGAETDEGTFRVHMKSRNHTSSLYRTWMPFALFFNGDEAVHYSPYFARDGYLGGSHGCVNLRDFKGAEALFDRVPLGTRAHVYWS